MSDPRSEPLAIIGAGVAGLITAHTLICDGFTDVQILTRDAEVGGVWAKHRVYPGLYLNNVHGEYRLSPLERPRRATSETRLTGDDMAQYMEEFAVRFLQGVIQFNVEVRNVRCHPSGKGWQLDARDVQSNATETREYARIVLCTGGCSTPRVPEAFTSDSIAAAGYKGFVFHSADFASKMNDLLACAPFREERPDTPPVVVIGGGKSAQDISSYLANEGRKVTLVCNKLDAFAAGPKPPPDFLRRSRIMSLFSPHIHLRTILERFLHTTWVGKKIVGSVWKNLADSSFQAMNIPQGSPLRNTLNPFWHIRVNDEGVPRANGFHALALSGKINVLTSAHATRFGGDGSIVLSDGTSLGASAVVLATGYKSSWLPLFEASTFEELGLGPRPAETRREDVWNYTTLADPPPLHPEAQRWESSIYRGLVPAVHIARRDIAINGTCPTSNNGYTIEVAAHWISSYLLGDSMRLPVSADAALAVTAQAAAWLRRRYPEIPTALNTSHTGYLAFWTWPQHTDDLLEDMGVRVMRSGGNALTWPFKVIDPDDIKDLKAERDKLRQEKGGLKARYVAVQG
ncbi:FAD/NAD(P)-binding domain-containing protein [Trametes elegans]|nr:FAD/NAD(P)-binding domain-containing protein [Trametes elegans]